MQQPSMRVWRCTLACSGLGPAGSSDRDCSTSPRRFGRTLFPL